MQPLPHSLLAASGSDSDEQPQVVELQEEEAAQLPSTIVSDVRSTPSANILEAYQATKPSLSIYICSYRVLLCLLSLTFVSSDGAEHLCSRLCVACANSETTR